MIHAVLPPLLHPKYPLDVKRLRETAAIFKEGNFFTTDEIEEWNTFLNQEEQERKESCQVCVKILQEDLDTVIPGRKKRGASEPPLVSQYRRDQTSRKRAIRQKLEQHIHSAPHPRISPWWPGPSDSTPGLPASLAPVSVPPVESAASELHPRPTTIVLSDDKVSSVVSFCVVLPIEVWDMMQLKAGFIRVPAKAIVAVLSSSEARKRCPFWLAEMQKDVVLPPSHFLSNAMEVDDTESDDNMHVDVDIDEKADPRISIKDLLSAEDLESADEDDDYQDPDEDEDDEEDDDEEDEEKASLLVEDEDEEDEDEEDQEVEIQWLERFLSDAEARRWKTQQFSLTGRNTLHTRSGTNILPFSEILKWRWTKQDAARIRISSIIAWAYPQSAVKPLRGRPLFMLREVFLDQIISSLNRLEANIRE